MDHKRIKLELDNARRHAENARYYDKYNHDKHVQSMEISLSGVIILTENNHDQYLIDPYLNEMAEIERIAYRYHPEEVKLRKAEYLYRQGEKNLAEIELKLAENHAKWFGKDIAQEIQRIRVGSVNIDYILMSNAHSFPQGLHILRKICESNPTSYGSVQPQINGYGGVKLYRPLTVKEIYQARVNNYEKLNNSNGSKRSLQDRLFFFERSLHSCSAIINKQNSTNFKILELSWQLVNLAENFRDNYLPIDYNLTPGKEFNQIKNGVKYNQDLNETQANSHPALLHLMGDTEDGKKLLQTHNRILYSELKRRINVDSGSGFFVKQYTIRDQLRAIDLTSFPSYYSIFGNNGLDDLGYFLLRSV